MSRNLFFITIFSCNMVFQGGLWTSQVGLQQEHELVEQQKKSNDSSECRFVCDGYQFRFQLITAQSALQISQRINPYATHDLLEDLWDINRHNYNVARVLRIIEQGGVDVNTRHYLTGRSILSEFLSCGVDIADKDVVYNMVKMLLRKGARLDVWAGGNTMLMAGVLTCDCRIVEMLLQAGAYRQIDAQTKRGRTALMMAAAREAVDVVRMLCAWGADSKIVDANGNTALGIALERCSPSSLLKITQLISDYTLARNNIPIEWNTKKGSIEPFSKKTFAELLEIFDGERRPFLLAVIPTYNQAAYHFCCAIGLVRDFERRGALRCLGVDTSIETIFLYKVNNIPDALFPFDLVGIVKIEKSDTQANFLLEFDKLVENLLMGTRTLYKK